MFVTSTVYLTTAVLPYNKSFSIVEIKFSASSVVVTCLSITVPVLATTAKPVTEILGVIVY